MNKEVCKGYKEVLDPLLSQNRSSLRKKATQLKQMDGEGWAIGETVERACILLDALDISNVKREEEGEYEPEIGAEKRIIEKR